MTSLQLPVQLIKVGEHQQRRCCRGRRRHQRGVFITSQEVLDWPVLLSGVVPTAPTCSDGPEAQSNTRKWDKNGSVPSIFHVKEAIRAVIVRVEMLLRGVAEPKETTERAG